MKKLLVLFSLGVSLFASELMVKKADVKISINGDIKELLKDETLKLTPGSSICFLEGKGKVVIGKRKQLSKKSKKCYTTSIPEGFKMDEFIQGLKDTAKVALITGEMKVKDGVSTRSINMTETISGNHTITNTDKKIVIYNENYGPLPVTLTVYDTEKNILKSYVNEDSIVTFFMISSENLKNNYSLVVTNAFEDELLKQVIIKEEVIENASFKQ